MEQQTCIRAQPSPCTCNGSFLTGRMLEEPEKWIIRSTCYHTGTHLNNDLGELVIRDVFLTIKVDEQGGLSTHGDLCTRLRTDGKKQDHVVSQGASRC